MEAINKMIVRTLDLSNALRAPTTKGTKETRNLVNL
jgi:hypothetical protein